MKKKIIYEDAYQEIMYKIRTMRKQKGMKQFDLAKKIGKDQRYVSKVETCIISLDILELWQIIDILGLDFKKLMSRFDDRLRENKDEEKLE